MQDNKMKWKQQVVVIVYIIIALLNNIKDNENRVNYTHVFNITFIVYLMIQLIFITNNLNN